MENKKINEISKIVDKIYDIGDKDECSTKNFVYGFYSIYNYNDLEHIIDYSSNGHSDKDTKKFIKLWNKILNKLKNLKKKQKKTIINEFIEKDMWCYYDYDYPSDKTFRGLR